jgi:hypothetical protein
VIASFGTQRLNASNTAPRSARAGRIRSYRQAPPAGQARGIYFAGSFADRASQPAPWRRAIEPAARRRYPQHGTAARSSSCQARRDERVLRSPGVLQWRGIRLAKDELDGLWVSRGKAEVGHLRWAFTRDGRPSGQRRRPDCSTWLFPAAPAGSDTRAGGHSSGLARPRVARSVATLPGLFYRGKPLSRDGNAPGRENLVIGSSPPLMSMSAMQMSAPSRARRTAVPRPMPETAPVMSATFPERCVMRRF